MPILAEGRYGGGSAGDWFGYTPNYLPVRLIADEGEDLANRILEVQVGPVHQDGDHLIALR
jgi:hypothetical protein